MKKQFTIFLFALALVNGIAGILLFYVYFPWSSNVDYRTSQQEIRGDLLDLNLRMASNEYRFSKAIVDRASFDLNRSINQKRPSELELSEDISEKLVKERYQVFMEYEEGPVGILKLNEQSYLVLGPYEATYDDVKLKDGFAYLLLLLLFNGACLWAGLSYLRSKFSKANQAINQVASSIYLDKQDDVFENVAINTPEISSKISMLQSEHRKNLRNQRDLMHAVAHEFRSPMARISMAVDLLTAGQQPQKSEQLKIDIEESLEELDALVKEVLDYSRLKDGQQSLSPNYFNMIELIESVINKVSPLYPTKIFDIETIDQTSIECFLDQKLIERALLNLIRNAAKFSFSKVLVSVQSNQTNLVISVADDGNGVPPGKRDRIFEPFTRLDHSRSRDSGGAGLGLAIVWGIANRHQGKIEVKDSGLLGGADFHLKVPFKISP